METAASPTAAKRMGLPREAESGQGVVSTAERCPQVAPNQALHLTAYSLRAYGAPASGSR